MEVRPGQLRRWLAFGEPEDTNHTFIVLKVSDGLGEPENPAWDVLLCGKPDWYFESSIEGGSEILDEGSP